MVPLTIIWANIGSMECVWNLQKDSNDISLQIKPLTSSVKKLLKAFTSFHAPKSPLVIRFLVHLEAVVVVKHGGLLYLLEVTRA